MPTHIQARRVPVLLLLQLLLLSLLGLGTPDKARAQDAAELPQLDVPYVPTPPEVVERMLQIANVGPEDYLIDLGSGDGRIVIAAVQDFDAQSALGVDIDPVRVAEARANARDAGVEDRARFQQGDLFEQDLSAATVVTLYLLASINLELRPHLLEQLAPGTRVVSHAFHMGDWVPDLHERVSGSDIYLWIIPARVQGRWLVRHADGSEFILNLEQRFQEIDGYAEAGNSVTRLSEATLEGGRIRFRIGTDEYLGDVQGDLIQAIPVPSAQRDWQASRM